MYYVADILTPLNTAKVNALSTKLKVSSGFVYQVELEFPAGCAGLLYCLVKKGGVQIWPSSNDVWFRSSGHIISFPEAYPIITAPFELNIFTYNLDDTYDHTVIVRVGLLSELQYKARFMPSASIDELVQYFKDLEAERQTIDQDFLDNPFPFSEGE